MALHDTTHKHSFEKLQTTITKQTLVRANYCPAGHRVCRLSDEPAIASIAKTSSVDYMYTSYPRKIHDKEHKHSSNSTYPSPIEVYFATGETSCEAGHLNCAVIVRRGMDAVVATVTTTRVTDAKINTKLHRHEYVNDFFVFWMTDNFATSFLTHRECPLGHSLCVATFRTGTRTTAENISLAFGLTGWPE